MPSINENSPERAVFAPKVRTIGFCGPSHAQVRTEREQISELVTGIMDKCVQDPLILDRLPPFIPPTPPEPPPNPGHAAIRRINWERRVKRLKKDWYGKDRREAA